MTGIFLVDYFLMFLTLGASICSTNLVMLQEWEVVAKPNCFNSNANFTANKRNVLKFQSSFPISSNLVHIHAIMHQIS